MMEKIERNFRRFAAEIRNELKKVKQSVDRVHRVGVVDSVDVASDTVSITDGPASARVLDHWKPIVGDRVMWSMKGGDPFVVGAFGTSHSGVMGGVGNSVTDALNATVIGGETNALTDGKYSTVIGGDDNALYDTPKSAIISSTLSTIRGSGGAVSVIIGGNNSTIGDPLGVGIWSGYRCLVQGQGNELAPLNGCTAVVQMTQTSSINNATQSAVIGGEQNDLDDTKHSGIFAGRFSEITGAYRAGILAGDTNVINNTGADQAVILGGQNNTISGASLHAAILGGSQSLISGTGNRHTIIGSSLSTINTSNNEVGIYTSNSCTITAGLRAGIIGSTASSVSHSLAWMIGCTSRSSKNASTVHVDNLHVFSSYVTMANLPTSNAGLAAGRLWVSGTSPNKYVRMA